jgi:flagellar motor switch protein FliM
MFTGNMGRKGSNIAVRITDKLERRSQNPSENLP